jgi:hypothetical protein
MVSGTLFRSERKGYLTPFPLWPVLGPVTKVTITDAARRWSEAGRYLGHAEEAPENNLPTE